MQLSKMERDICETTVPVLRPASLVRMEKLLGISDFCRTANNVGSIF